VVVDKQVEGRVTPTRVDGILLSYETEDQTETAAAEQKEEDLS